MTDATLIADMIRAGVDPDIIQRVVSALMDSGSEGQQRLSKAEMRAERNRRYYENKRLKASESVLTKSETSDSDAIKTQTLPLSPSLPLPPQTPPSPAHPHTPAPVRTREAEASELDGSTKPAKTNGKGTLAELEAYAVEIGLPASDGTAMFDHWTANGWRNGSSPSKCWKAGMRKWKGQGWMPSQTGRKSGFNGHRPKHAAYDAKTATAGMSQDDILKF